MSEGVHILFHFNNVTQLKLHIQMKNKSPVEPSDGIILLHAISCPHVAVGVQD